jgi:hypothetical protein
MRVNMGASSTVIQRLHQADNSIVLENLNPIYEVRPIMIVSPRPNIIAT